MKSFPANRLASLPALILVGTLLASMDSQAALGGVSDSVQGDALHFHATAHLSRQEVHWSVQEIQQDSGTMVHEYLNDAGKVFAVSWTGPVMPDLQQLLGADNFSQISTPAAGDVHRGHGATQRMRNDLVYVSEGRLRHFHGKAWQPSLLPSGFSTDSIE